MIRGSSPILAIFAFILIASPVSSCWAAKWVMEDETVVYGEVVKYDFASKELTLVKDSDGKEAVIDGRALNFGSKWQLISQTRAFRDALKSYKPPLGPILIAVLVGVLATALPIFLGIWGGAQVLGSVAGLGKHLKAFAKVILVVLFQFAVIALGLLALDSDMPLIPDKNADVLLIMMVMVLGLLAIALVLSIHYKRSYRAGLGITLLGCVFAGIVGTAMMLGALFLLTRGNQMDALITRYVFEPLGWF